ncbi:DNA-directed RNA polymerase iii subunit rpc9-like protein, partial [Trifolium pratense]
FQFSRGSEKPYPAQRSSSPSSPSPATAKLSLSLKRFEKLYLLQKMKILDANVAPLTNFEVLDFLRSKGASKDPSRVIAKVAMSEYKVCYSLQTIWLRLD